MYDRKLFAMEDQVVVVTGAGDGIGRAIAETFASAGAAVMVSDLQVESASGVADHIESIGGRAVAAGCDITNEEDLERIVASAVDQFGKLTHVVSNAGGGGPKPFDMPMTDFRKAFDLNVHPLFRLAQLAAP